MARVDSKRPLPRQLAANLWLAAVLLLTGCAATEDAVYLAPIPEETLNAYDWDKPVETLRSAGVTSM